MKRRYTLKSAGLAAVFAVACSAKAFALDFEVGIASGADFYGYGQRLGSLVSSAGRGLGYDAQKLEPFSFNLGIEGAVLKSLYENDFLHIQVAGLYSLKYDFENFSFTYGDPPPGVPPTGGIGGSGGGQLYPGKGLKDRYNMQSLVNRIVLGGRTTLKRVPLWLQAGGGVLFYNPFYLEYSRWSGDKYKVWAFQHKRVNFSSYDLDFSLQGTQESLAVVEVRLGYGPVYVGFEYATNWRVNAMNVQLGVNLYPLQGWTDL